MLTYRDLWDRPLYNQWGDGYRLKEARRYWVVAAFYWLDFKDEEYAGPATAYAGWVDDYSITCGELMDEVLVFESYRDAKAEAEHRSNDKHTWYPLNLADHDRRDRWQCAGLGRFTGYEFTASERAFAARDQVRKP